MNEGDTASVQCIITKGDNPLKFNWFLNNKPVNKLDGIFINKLGKKISILHIESVQAEHSGEYTCSATNPAGSVNHTAVLLVNGINSLKSTKVA